jgi:hypothetical protein
MLPSWAYYFNVVSGMPDIRNELIGSISEKGSESCCGGKVEVERE